MDQQLSALASVLASAAAWAWMSLVNSLRTLIAVDVRTYRPEKYYMRGPGPKWREKHARGHVSPEVGPVPNFSNPAKSARQRRTLTLQSVRCARRPVG